MRALEDAQRAAGGSGKWEVTAADGAGGVSDAPLSSPPPHAPPPQHTGLYRSIWVSLLLTCNPALQARAPEQLTLHSALRH